MISNHQIAAASVGPHEGCELELMLAGKKPLAMFCDAVGHTDWFPEADFAPYVAQGRIVRREEVYHAEVTGLPGRYVYFAVKGEEWRIDALHRINERLFVQHESTSDEIEREIGRLLGYTEIQIDQYLAWVSRSAGGRE